MAACWVVWVEVVVVVVVVVVGRSTVPWADRVVKLWVQ